MPMQSQDKGKRLKNVPSIDQLLRTGTIVQLQQTFGIRRLTTIARMVTAELRSEIRADLETEAQTAEALLAEATRRIERTCRFESLTGIKHVINATGVVLHTNLGRAALSDAAREAITAEAARYCTLEYDSASGTRGRRAARAESLLKELTGAEDALVVNNCAAAALLILSVLAGDGETLVSRGELVEIGGDFRVPDVMANSGTRMVEVGTTNRTRLEDYTAAITDRTRLLMRVHPSNYRIVGFASSPSLNDLSTLAHRSNLPLYADAGSGLMGNPADIGLNDEPRIGDLISDGVDVVSFSGDKLLGSAQAGLIVGKTQIVERLRKHPLYRALRSDKLRLAALEATLEAHRRNSALEEIPTLRMLALTREEIDKRASRMLNQLSVDKASKLKAELIPGESAVGGGAGATTVLPTTLVALVHETLSAQDIENKLRKSSPPVIARIAEEKVLLDLRTVFPDEESHLLDVLRHLVR